MRKYNHKTIEKKWQKKWEQDGIYKTSQNIKKKSLDTVHSKKCFVLDMFPYPSGEGLHIGHPKGYIATDVYSRFKRMNGYEVLHPMGWDAFGLPAENFALKNKTHPKLAIKKNIKRFKEQLFRLGFDYDWDREINTTDPAYYKWTQWIFLQLFKKGLAYESDEPINWCPSCKTGLANEDVEDGKCERCGAIVEKKKLRQWVLRIREYADRLLKDLDELDWPESIKESQRNWIGRSDGWEISFPLSDSSFQKKHFVLLHGKGGSSDSNFLPWLKKELEKTGSKVEVPNLPNTNEPNDDEQADFVIKHCMLDENTVILGHSFGGVVLTRLLERGIKIDKAILVATPFTGNFLDGKIRHTVLKACKKGFNFKKIKSNARSFIVIGDIKDNIISLSDSEVFAAGLGVEPIKKEGEMPHFIAAEEPFLKEVIIPHIKIFTTRPDTLFGATYIVLAPEHELANKVEGGKLKVENAEEVAQYVKRSKRKSEFERLAERKEKTGVELKEIRAINPASGKEIPIWIADYVLADYGTGAIMAVPAHDERDFEFAKKYDLPAREVIIPSIVDHVNSHECAYIGSGVLTNSGEFDGINSEEAKGAITKFIGGKKTVTYKLRDWVFSRQRYWGEPIPIIHCEKCGAVPVSEKDLPVLLPDVKSYEPTGTGESPLANIKNWVNTECPRCGGAGKRETNTMPQWAGSSWYYLAYIMRGIFLSNDSKQANLSFPISKYKDGFKKWLPVDVYVGGAEHATRHLIYARFWHKFLYDIKVVNYKEPFIRLKNQGLILGDDGRKMSKRWGNVVNPDDIVERFGADSLRVYEMFMGPFGDGIAWNVDGVIGARRFLERVWRLKEKINSEEKIINNQELETLMHQTIKKVTGDIETFKFNTAISALMIYGNELDKKDSFSENVYKPFLLLLSPFAPHITEEIWNILGYGESIHKTEWPMYAEEKTLDETMTIVVQVDGKTRDQFIVSSDESAEVIKEKAQTLDKVLKWVQGNGVQKIIYVPRKLVNIVTRVDVKK